MVNFSNHNIDNTPEFSFIGKEFECRLVDIYDADTITVIINVNDKFWKYTVRIYGIDTPEIRTRDDVEKIQAYIARQRVIDLLCYSGHCLSVASSRDEIQKYLKNTIIKVWIKCYDFGNFGRLLADVFSFSEKLELGPSIGEVLLQENLANKY